MSAERPKGKTAIPLTPDQTGGVVENIIKQWGGENGITFTEESLEALINQFGPDAKVEDVIKALKGKGKTSD